MKKLFLFCLMATTVLAFDSCRKDPVYIDDNGNVIDVNREPIASFTYTTQQITGGLAIKCNNTSSYATNYEWFFNGSTSYQTNPTFYVYSAGTYRLELTASNQYGSDYTYRTITVTAAPTGYEMTSLKLTKIPMYDSNNETWDTGLEGNGNPDIFFKILDENKEITYCTSQRVDNVSTLPHGLRIHNWRLERNTLYNSSTMMNILLMTLWLIVFGRLMPLRLDRQQSIGMPKTAQLVLWWVSDGCILQREPKSLSVWKKTATKLWERFFLNNQKKLKLNT